ncbi:MAG: RNA 2',3'-cyclic phosphodiesterase [Deltaproteobacteria bacterium]|nr:RNA 2',3'-cyclic phosphodiesterase [Deltaproteobacteria bacterium]
MTDEKTKRVFLAIDLPDDIKAQLVAIQNKLKFLLEGVRWTRPEGIHLTLKFFGTVVAEDIVRISEVVEQHTKNAQPIALHGEKVGAFPNFQRPRVLWLGLNGDIERLSALHRAIEKDLDRYGYKKEKRGFKPHLTLGRAKSSRGIILGLPEAIKRDDTYKAGQFDSNGLTLFESKLKPGGAVYTKLAYFPFGG